MTNTKDILFSLPFPQCFYPPFGLSGGEMGKRRYKHVIVDVGETARLLRLLEARTIKLVNGLAELYDRRQAEFEAMKEPGTRHWLARRAS